MVTIKLSSPLKLRLVPPSQAGLRQLGAAAVETVLARVGRHQNANDGPARPYSQRGPIYVPNAGVQGRAKQRLGGREVLSSKDRSAIRKAGRGGLMGKTRGGKTTRFANYAAYKRALGKTGQRDLELSGRMLGSIGIVRLSASSVVIGFSREAEHQKAKGNERHDAWFALSPRDVTAVVKHAAEVLKPRIVAD
jgi:hypothetical protein